MNPLLQLLLVGPRHWIKTSMPGYIVLTMKIHKKYREFYLDLKLPLSSMEQSVNIPEMQSQIKKLTTQFVQ